jgi:hypothetical protein
MNNLFCEAEFWRPTGLGNRLFSWARAGVFSSETGAVMLSPRWAHLRGASILRGGIDYSNALRKILLFDNFKPAPGELTGWRRYRIKRALVKKTVMNLPQAMDALSNLPSTEKRLVSFAGHTEHIFDDLWEYQQEINTKLRLATRPKWFPKTSVHDHPFIGINIRMGKDFKTASNGTEFLHNKKDFLRTPLGWFVESLRFVRKEAGYDVPAVVVTDGSREDLAVLLEEPSVLLPVSKSAVGDLLVLSGSAILIGSGRSSFSAWASFLGQMPTVTIPGSSLQSFHVTPDPEIHYVGELDPEHPEMLFINSIKRRFHV